MRNCCITISEIEVVFRRADFRCSGSLYSMLLYKNCIGFKFSINIFWTKRMIHVHYVSTRWLVVSFLTGYLSEFGFSRYTFSRNDRLNRHNVWVFTSCAGRENCELSKCWYWSRILFCRARPPQQLHENFLNFPITTILPKILFWSAIRSQINLKFSFALRDRNFFFFSFISLSVYFLCQMLIWPGSEFIRWPTRLSHAGVYVLHLAFNLM